VVSETLVHSFGSIAAFGNGSSMIKKENSPMQISSLSSASYQPAGGTQAISKMKQSFEDLGSALESGDLSSAKDVLAQMNKDAPAQGSGDNPMSQKLDTLTKAVESGDVKAAQQSYADIKETMEQGPGSGGAMAGFRGMAGGKQSQSGSSASGGQKSSSASSSADSSKTYDKKDGNEDGKVTTMEEIEYDLEHPDKSQESSTSSAIDITA
jgi:hypothetical protein